MLSFVIRRLPLSCLSPRRGLQPMLHGMIIACDNLPTNSLGKMYNERRFQIQSERAADIADNDEHLCIVWTL